MGRDPETQRRLNRIWIKRAQARLGKKGHEHQPELPLIAPAGISSTEGEKVHAKAEAENLAPLKAHESGIKIELDTELLIAGLTLAAVYIETGIRSYPDYTRAMVAGMGDVVRPYLRLFYEAIRNYPGFEAKGMTPYEEIGDAAEQLSRGKTVRKPAKWIQDLKAKAKAMREDEDLLHNRLLHKQILSTWKLDSPRMYRRLQRAGVLEDQAFVAQEQMWLEAKALMAGGMAYPDALEQAEREHLMLEPEPDPAEIEETEQYPSRYLWMQELQE